MLLALDHSHRPTLSDIPSRKIVCACAVHCYQANSEERPDIITLVGGAGRGVKATLCCGSLPWPGLGESGGVSWYHHSQEGRNGVEENIDCKVFPSLVVALADVV